MVREAERRTRKYETNVDGDQVGRAITALKPIMVDQEKTYLPRITMIERKTKAICEAQGVTTFEVAQYINYARELYSKAEKFSQATLTAEAQNMTDKWYNRGLLCSLLQKIAKLFGITVTCPLGPVFARIDVPFQLMRETFTDKRSSLCGGRTIIDFANWATIAAIYFEAVAWVPFGSSTISVRNMTDGVIIAGSTLTFTDLAMTIKRSGDIKANFPSGQKEYAAYVDAIPDVLNYCGARLIILITK